MRINFDPLFPTGIHEACYQPADLPEHVGNPLIEALPPFRCANEMIRTFGKFPPIGPQDRSMDASKRILAVSRLDNYLEPLPAHFDVIEKIGQIVRIGYSFRNPLQPDVMKEKTEFYRQVMKEGKILPIEYSTPSTAPSFALFGLSGVGKSTVVERTLCFLPQVILHKQHEFVQVVWMKIDCPQDGSLKQLLLWMIAAFDNLLGTTHIKDVRETVTTDALLLKVSVLSHIYNLGILILDETQNLTDAKGEVSIKTMNFFLTFANMVKIPLVLVGTQRAMNLFDKQFRTARRVSEHGVFIWNRLKFGEEWTFFLESLWKYQWTSQVTPLTDSLSKVFYDKTQGIHSLVVMLFQLAQIQAIKNGTEGKSEILTEELISQVASEKFKLAEFTLNYIRGEDSKGNKIKNKTLQSMGKTLEDVFRDSLVGIKKEVDNKVTISKLKENAKKNNQIITERYRAVSALKAMGYDESFVDDVVVSLFDADSNMTSEIAVSKIVGLVNEKGSSSGNPEWQSLKAIIRDGAEAGVSPYSALTSAGIIQELSDEN